MLESADEIAVIFLSDKNILTRVKQKKNILKSTNLTKDDGVNEDMKEIMNGDRSM